MDLKKIATAGYVFELESDTRDWRNAHDEKWEIVMSGALEGRVLGERRIDGVAAVVFQAGEGIYAITSAAARASATGSSS